MKQQDLKDIKRELSAICQRIYEKYPLPDSALDEDAQIVCRQLNDTIAHIVNRIELKYKK
jgi:hypothetical protein